MASSSIVIKVKFGETLRRFGVAIHNKKLELDVVGLRAKIRGLFSFDSDADFTLTYIDEDGDVVTLADDDDLLDVVRQSLNPLRIRVSLKPNKNGGSTGTSTPQLPGVMEMMNSVPEPLRESISKLSNDFALKATSSASQLPFQGLNSGLLEMMKSVPEPLHEAISKLSHDFAVKATSSSPALAELLEKIKIVPDSMAGPRAHGVPDVKGQPGAGVAHSEAGGSKLKNKEEQLLKEAEGLKLKDTQHPGTVDLNVPYFDNETLQAPVDKGVKALDGRSFSGVVYDISYAEKNKGTADGVEKASGSEKKKDADSGSLSAFEQWKATAHVAPGHDHAMQVLQQYRTKVTGDSSSSSTAGPVGQKPKTKETGDSSSSDIPKAANDSINSSDWVQGMLNATNQCPFTGLPLPNDSNFNVYHHPSRSPRHKRGFHHGNSIAGIFHRGVRCDGCGVHPITGPRFKSKVKEDYDLCSICLERMGNTSDYIRLDHPVNYRHPTPFKGFHDHSLHIPPPMLPHALRAPGSKLPRSKLDSRFILDVNVLDGTIMAPFTTFTKIWRMRNNGTIIWPRGSQLQWIGGDRLSNMVSVEIEIPADGLPVDKELDVAVDFTAPELPGRYISYWRMASPSGQKFGQRVWVLIQVDTSMKDLGDTSINLNLPPVMKKYHEALHEGIFMDNLIRDTESENPFVDAQPKDQDKNFPINDTLIVGDGFLSSSTASLYPPPLPGSYSGPSSAEIVYPSVGVVELLPTVAPLAAVPAPVVQPQPAAAPPAAVPVPMVQPQPAAAPLAGLPVVLPAAATEEVSGDDMEQALLRELKEMGFNQMELNKEILRMNKYDLEKSVDDLCGVSEWDPMLEELQEMGFSDNEANRRLLKKNNGSIKRVVMDLINGETA